MRSVSREINLRRWASELKDWQMSGLTQKEWCQLNGQSLSSFKWHLKQVRAEIRKRQGMPSELETTPAALAPCMSTPDFAEIPLTALHTLDQTQQGLIGQAAISVELKTATVNIMTGASPEQIRTVLAVMSDV